VLFVRELHISRSLRRHLRGGFTVTADTAFRAVVEACAGPRSDANGTWITPEVIDAYSELSRLGHAHSIETWIDGELAGGLYGVAIGRMFYGESMFAHRSDASKIALAHLAHQLDRWGFEMIDCQMSTNHLASLGAREIRRREFVDRMRALTTLGDIPGPWRFDADLSATVQGIAG